MFQSQKPIKPHFNDLVDRFLNAISMKPKPNEMVQFVQ